MALDLTPSAIIGIILGVLISLAIVAFALGIIGLLTPVVDEGTVNNFNALTAKIEVLIDDPNPFVSNIDDPQTFYLMDGVILVGYNSDSGKQHTDCSNEFATKPSQLIGRGGLCLQQEDYGNNFDSGYKTPAPIQCYAFDKPVIFLAPKDDSYQGGFGGSESKLTYPFTNGQKYEDLFLYGSECDLGEPDLGPTKLYIEVLDEGEEVYVYINEDSTENQLIMNKKRFEELKKEIL